MKSHTAQSNTSHANKIYSYTVNLKLEPHGPEVHREPVLAADLIEIYSEAWLTAYLRKGQPQIGYSDLAFRLLPLFDNDSNYRCANLVIESKQSDGNIRQSRQSVAALRTVAERGAKQLLETGIIGFGQPYYYDVSAKVSDQADMSRDSSESAQSKAPNIKYSPLTYRKVPLSSLIKKATAVGAVRGGLPIFIRRSTYLMAERFARKGARYQPPVESGAVVLGWLGSCPDTGEFFVVATDVIELVDALQSKIALTYTDKTWANIHAVLRERRSNPAAAAERIVGQCHGHNFLPCIGENDCNHCEQKNRCTATSAFVSEHDLLWSRCVFSRQPWAFCQIFGLDARGTHEQRMFGFRQGRLVERGFYVTP